MSQAKVPVLIVINNLDSGGAERHLLAVLPGLARRGYAPAVFTLTHRGQLAARFEAAGIPVLGGDAAAMPPPAGALRQALRLLATAFALRTRLRRQPPAILHFFLPAAYLLGGLASLGTGNSRRVMSRRSLNDYQRRHPAAAWIERLLHRRMDLLLGNSQAVTAQLRAEGAPPDRLHCLPNGIDLAPFDRAPARAETRAALGLAPETLVLVIVANLIPYKGHADLLGALGHIKAELPASWRLFCVGRDEGIGAGLRLQAEAAGIAPHVVWLGERTDVPALLGAADIALLCSHEEGFANAILEAMAARLPVIATRVGGNGEAVVEGETGFLVSPRAPFELAAAIRRLAGDVAQRQAMGRAGRTRIEQEFSLERCVAGYDRLYRGILGGTACAD